MFYLLFDGLRYSTLGAEALWDHFTSHWEYYTTRFPPTLSMFSSLFRFIGAGFSNSQQLQKMRDFFATKKTDGYSSAVEELMEAVQAKASWVERDSEDLITWLKSNEYME